MGNRSVYRVQTIDADTGDEKWIMVPAPSMEEASVRAMSAGKIIGDVQVTDIDYRWSPFLFIRSMRRATIIAAVIALLIVGVSVGIVALDESGVVANAMQGPGPGGITAELQNEIEKAIRVEYRAYEFFGGMNYEGKPVPFDPFKMARHRALLDGYSQNDIKAMERVYNEVYLDMVARGEFY